MIAKIGWPMGALQVLWQLGSMALFLILSELPENRVEILAAFTAGLRIESAIYLPAFAFNMANAVIVGNLLGQKKQEEAYRSGLMTALIGVSVVVALVIIVISNARWITSLLSSNPVVARECCKVYLHQHDKRALHGVGHYSGRRNQRRGRHEKRHGPGCREHLVRPAPIGLPACRRVRLRACLSLVVHEYLAVRPILPPLQEVFKKAVAGGIRRLIFVLML